MINPAGTRGSTVSANAKMSFSQNPTVDLKPYSFSNPNKKAVKADENMDIKNNNVLSKKGLAD